MVLKSREKHGERKQGRLHRKYLSLVSVLGPNKGDVPWVRSRVWLPGVEWAGWWCSGGVDTS